MDVETYGARMFVSFVEMPALTLPRRLCLGWLCHCWKSTDAGVVAAGLAGSTKDTRLGEAAGLGGVVPPLAGCCGSGFSDIVQRPSRTVSATNKDVERLWLYSKRIPGRKKLRKMVRPKFVNKVEVKDR
jgi:hypothetical protein